MKKYILIVILLLLFLPVIPYEYEIQDGVTTVENRSIASWVWERYQKVQAQEEVKINQAPVAQ